MHLSLLPPTSGHAAYLCGDVTVSERAVLAPGAILQAAPGSCIVIEEGVFIGAGASLTACGGTIAVRAGAIVGPNALIFGRSTVGAGACVGAAATVCEADVAPGAAIAARALIGDPTRQPAAAGTSADAEPPAAPPAPPAPETTAPDSVAPPAEPPAPEPAPEEAVASEAAETSTNGSAPAAPGGGVVYGRRYVEQMMVSLFPHRQSLSETTHSETPDNE